jgi:hypothetical protein
MVVVSNGRRLTEQGTSSVSAVDVVSDSKKIFIVLYQIYVLVPFTAANNLLAEPGRAGEVLGRFTPSRTVPIISVPVTSRMVYSTV